MIQEMYLYDTIKWSCNKKIGIEDVKEGILENDYDFMSNKRCVLYVKFKDTKISQGNRTSPSELDYHFNGD